MKFSTHTIIVNDYPAAGEHLVYNTRTQALIKIKEDLKNLIENYTARPADLTDTAVQSLRALHRAGIIVKDEEEDRQRLLAHLDQLKYGRLKDRLVVTVLTTYACNFKCTYCFEESSRKTEKMEPATAGQVIAWLKNKISEEGFGEVFLVFYGGEPLANRPAIDQIAGQMQAWCRARGIGFKFMLQTNGFLLTEEVVDHYLALGLSQVRISIDGVGEKHDRTRPLRGGGGTFGRIMQNIEANADKVKIGLSVGFDQGETAHIEELIAFLKQRGVLYKLGKFIFGAIHAALGPAGHTEKIVSPQCMCNYENENLTRAYKKIHALLEQNGLPVKDGLSTSVCPVTREHSAGTIDQHGRIYKCNSMLGHPELSTGNIFDEPKNAKHQEFVSLDVWKQCPQDCTYMPMCGGGCRLSSFLNNKNFRTPTCHKPYLNQMAPDFIKREYEVQLRKRSRKTAQANTNNNLLNKESIYSSL